MKNEDKGKLKYMVVVIALLVGIGLASAQPCPYTTIGDGYVWICNDTPYQSALRVNDTSVNDGSAVVINFTRTGGYTTFACGVNVTGAQTDRGSNTGIRGQTSLNVPDEQDGLAVGSLAGSSGWHSHGNFYGVFGRSTPNSLSNWDNTFTSMGLGGKFYAGPDDTHTLTLGTGTYWVGGVYGKVEGHIDGTPTAGAVAGVIGIDNTTGTAPSYAGYFDGKVYHKGNVGIGNTSPMHKLHISGSEALNEGILVEHTGTGNAEFLLYGGGTGAECYGIYSTGSGASQGSGKFLIRDFYSMADRFAIDTNGNVGIGTTSPARKLHVNDVMRLQPRATAPSMPWAEGDIYMNGSSHKLMVYANSTWHACW